MGDKWVAALAAAGIDWSEPSTAPAMRKLPGSDAVCFAGIGPAKC